MSQNRNYPLLCAAELKPKATHNCRNKAATSDNIYRVSIVSEKKERRRKVPRHHKNCCSGKEVKMSPRQKKDICTNLNKALATRVTDSVKEEISQVLDVNTDRMTAGQAIAYAQVAKAIKGDKNAFEAITAATKDMDSETGFNVEIRVVD